MTTGNESDVEFSDCIADLALDEDTEMIATYHSEMQAFHSNTCLIEAIRNSRGLWLRHHRAEFPHAVTGRNVPP